MSNYFKEIRTMELREKKENADTIIFLARKAIAHFKNKKLKNITVSIELRYLNNSGVELYITVFSKDGDNTFFQFYDFTPKINNIYKFEEVIKLINTDNFEEIKRTNFN